MKGNTQTLVKFLAILIALLSIGMHWGIIVVPMLLKDYNFIMMAIAFLLLLASMLF